jgi:glycerol-3-phosphate O-acyltransferase
MERKCLSGVYDKKENDIVAFYNRYIHRERNDNEIHRECRVSLPIFSPTFHTKHILTRFTPSLYLSLPDEQVLGLDHFVSEYLTASTTGGMSIEVRGCAFLRGYERKLYDIADCMRQHTFGVSLEIFSFIILGSTHSSLHLYRSLPNQSHSSPRPHPLQEGTANIKQCLQFCFKYGMGPEKYSFGVSHQAIREPFDYYKFGVDFFRPAIDLPNSLVLGMSNLEKAMSAVKSGENVVFLANHQSEADPQVVSVLLDKAGFGEEAEGMTFLAGHKVTTDALAIPFSMGRNLLCIHSKKHIDAEPELKEVKQKQNLMTMGTMLEMMKSGGQCLWVAPSGGRDRRNVDTGEVPIARFDSKTIDMFRLMARKSKTATHFFPMSIVSYELCPPPDTVEAGTGERRNIRHTRIGITVGEETINEGGLEARHKFCENAEEECERNYKQLRRELFG